MTTDPQSWYAEITSWYYITWGIIQAITIVFLWRRDRREVHLATSDLEGGRESLVDQLRSRLASVCVTSLLPIRGLYLPLKDDERIQRDVEMIFANPDVLREIRDAHYLLFEFDSNRKRSRRLKSVQIGVSILGVFSLGGIAVTLAVDSFSAGPITWVWLFLLVESAGIVVGLALHRIKLNRRVQTILDDGSP